MPEPNRGSPPSTLRDVNRARLLAAIRERRASNRTELRTATGLSRSTVAGFVQDLLADGTLIEVEDTGLAGRAPGRPSRRLQLAPRADLVVAVDLGHSHCRIGIVDAAGTVVAEDNAALDVDGSADRVLQHARRVIRRLLRTGDREVLAGAVGLPAPVDVRNGSVRPGSVLPQWVGRRPAAELEQAIGIPFAVDNDANLGALAETSYGVARGLADVIYVKASTGIGAGFVLGGRVYRGSTGRAGEVGHVGVDPAGPVCRCGNRGCLETMASLTQVLHALEPRHGAPLHLDRVVALVADGDAGAIRVVTDAGRMIGRVLADAVNNLNPAMVVLGGELAAAGRPLLSGVHESITRYGQPGVTRDLRVELAGLGARSELLGAAALALHELDQAGVSSR